MASNPRARTRPLEVKFVSDAIRTAAPESSIKISQEWLLSLPKFGDYTFTAGAQRFIITETSPVQKFARFEVDASFLPPSFSLLRLTEREGVLFYIRRRRCILA